MRLTTSGLPNSALKKGIVAKVCREPLAKDDRADRILVTDKVAVDLTGYAGFLTSAKLESLSESVPTVSSAGEIDHLRTNDIVAMEPRNGFVRTLYRPDSNHNVIFATQRCNSNCLMCSQPPQDRDDGDASARRNLELIRLIDDPPKRLVITGGEPTLLGERLFSIIAAVRDKFPDTYLHMLTNGRIFAWSAFTSGSPN
jgi:sulfatase maturation enzyme AslB (radical SAM superfamily)